MIGTVRFQAPQRTQSTSQQLTVVMVNIDHVVSCHQINKVSEGVLLDGVGNSGVYTLGGGLLGLNVVNVTQRSTTELLMNGDAEEQWRNISRV